MLAFRRRRRPSVAFAGDEVTRASFANTTRPTLFRVRSMPPTIDLRNASRRGHERRADAARLIHHEHDVGLRAGAAGRAVQRDRDVDRPVTNDVVRGQASALRDRAVCRRRRRDEDTRSNGHHADRESRDERTHVTLDHPLSLPLKWQPTPGLSDRDYVAAPRFANPAPVCARGREPHVTVLTKSGSPDRHQIGTPRMRSASAIRIASPPMDAVRLAPFDVLAPLSDEERATLRRRRAGEDRPRRRRPHPLGRVRLPPVLRRGRRGRGAARRRGDRDARARPALRRGRADGHGPADRRRPREDAREAASSCSTATSATSTGRSPPSGALSARRALRACPAPRPRSDRSSAAATAFGAPPRRACVVGAGWPHPGLWQADNLSLGPLAAALTSNSVAPSGMGAERLRLAVRARYRGSRRPSRRGSARDERASPRRPRGPRPRPRPGARAPRGSRVPPSQRNGSGGISLRSGSTSASRVSSSRRSSASRARISPAEVARPDAVPGEAEAVVDAAAASRRSAGAWGRRRSARPRRA